MLAFLGRMRAMRIDRLSASTRVSHLSSATIASSAKLVSPSSATWPRHSTWFAAVPKLRSSRARMA